MLHCAFESGKMRTGAIVLQEWLTSVLSILYGMGVMRMKHFDFQDLIAFGMFILALLTFVFAYVK